MTDFDFDNLLAGLESCRRRLRDVWPRFAESPAHAVGYFLEVPGPLNQLLRHAGRIFIWTIGTKKRGILCPQMLEGHPSVPIGQIEDVEMRAQMLKSIRRHPSRLGQPIG